MVVIAPAGLVAGLGSIGAMVALEDEFREVNNYIRHVAQLLVAWYTFFVTANLIAAGWFVSASGVTGLLGTRRAMWIFCLIFVAVNILGLMALGVVRGYFVQADTRVREIVGYLSASTALTQPPATSPVPVRLFRRTTILMILSLAVLVSAWISLLVLI